MAESSAGLTRIVRGRLRHSDPSGRFVHEVPSGAAVRVNRRWTGHAKALQFEPRHDNSRFIGYSEVTGGSQILFLRCRVNQPQDEVRLQRENEFQIRPEEIAESDFKTGS
jgi:hypothetical protein